MERSGRREWRMIGIRPRVGGRPPMCDWRIEYQSCDRKVDAIRDADARRRFTTKHPRNNERKNRSVAGDRAI
jgi:hypothetical protein